MALPLFGSGGGVSRKVSPSLCGSDGVDEAALLATARRSLEALVAGCPSCEASLAPFATSLLGASSVDVDRPTMDAAARSAHDGLLRALVAALAPFGGTAEARAVLDYLARTADLTVACGGEVLRLLAPHCARSPESARVFCRAASVGSTIRPRAPTHRSSEKERPSKAHWNCCNSTNVLTSPAEHCSSGTVESSTCG